MGGSAFFVSGGTMALLRPQPVIDNPVTVRAAAALPALGAWDAAPTEVACAGFDWVMLYFTYTQGAAGGAMDFQVHVSPYAADIAGVEDWFYQSIYAAGAVAAGADTTSNVQRELITYGSTAAGAETFVYGPVRLDGTIERVRVRCRESGVTANPGDCHVVAVFYN
jgi:hypothetical protein